MFTTIGDTSYISGDFGKYDGIVKDNSVRYGRNSVDNFKKYLAAGIKPGVTAPNIDEKKLQSEDSFEKEISKADEFIKKLEDNYANFPGVKFVQQYMPGEIKDGNINKMALLGAAYEELGKIEVTKAEMEETMKKGLSKNDNISADALDVNKDGKIDLAEYSTSILLSDALSTNGNEVSAKNINGIVTNEGLNAILPYGLKANNEAAYKTYSYLYDFYKLGDAQKEFLNNPDNIQN